MAAYGDYRIVASGVEVKIFDVSNADNPTLASTYMTNPYPIHSSGAAVSGDSAYIASATYGTLTVVNLSDLSESGYCALTVSASSSAFSLDVSGDYAYVAMRPAGIDVIDITTKTSPVWVATFNEVYANDMAVQGNRGYMAASDAGLAIVDISNPASPVTRGKCDTKYQPVCIAASRDIACICDKYNGISVMNVAAPSSPQLLHTIHVGGAALSIGVQGDYLYIPLGSRGVDIYDVRNPSSPTFVTNFITGITYAQTIALYDGYAYIGQSFPNNIVVYDISNPSSPSYIRTVSTSDVVTEIATSGNCLYFVSSTSSSSYTKDLEVFDITDSSGLCKVDVSDPLNPLLVASSTPFSYATGITLIGEYLYVSDNNNCQVYFFTLNDISVIAGAIDFSSTDSRPQCIVQYNGVIFVPVGASDGIAMRVVTVE